VGVKGEVITTVRLPIAEIAAEVREKNSIQVPLADFRIEADTLLLFFSKPSMQTPAVAEEAPAAHSPTVSRKSAGRHGRKRHRMKTRGWKIVATINNSYNQRANVYEPFVEALSVPHLTSAQKRSAVAKILRGNGNRPTDNSVEYYLMNTQEYLDSKKEESKKGED
jgi:hypothetical protein